MGMMIDSDRPVHGSLPLDRWILSLQCKDTGVRVQMVVREQLALSVTNTRSHMDVCSLISDFLDATIV